MTSLPAFIAAGLKLPNGWFGCPYDNLHELTRSEIAHGDLILELDGQLALTFSGPTVASISDGILRLAGFTVLVWDWREYGSTMTHHEQFHGGVVEFIAQSA